MSNRLFQGIVHQLTDSIDRTIGVIDESGTIISCSELGKIGEVLSTEVTAVFSGTEVIIGRRGILISRSVRVCTPNMPYLFPAMTTLP